MNRAIELNDSAEISCMEISDEEFKKLAGFIYTNFGIHLPEVKKTLVISRLQKVVKSLGLKTFNEYYKWLVNDKTGNGISVLINQISTNFTYFYREEHHFEYFYRSALPEIVKKLQNQKQKDLRIWCAGCSSGEEAYMLAILLREFLGLDYSSWDAGVLATDISQRVLDIAKNGVYSLQSIKRVPGHLARKYFKHLNRDDVEVLCPAKDDVLFRRYNLMNITPPFKKQFDTIFCRNVMIYFDQETKHEVVKRFVNLLSKGGYLFIGHSESLGRDWPELKYIAPAIYQKV